MTDAQQQMDEVTPYSLPDSEQVKLLRRLMLYWDGQWFLKAVDALGLDEAIALNARVRASFGRIEMRSVLRALGKPRAGSLPDAIRLVEAYGRLLMGAALVVEHSTLDSNHAEIIVHRCPAYEGARLARLPRIDQACVACETLWNAWLETLLPDTGVEVCYPMRQGKGDPICRFVIHAGQNRLGTHRCQEP